MVRFYENVGTFNTDASTNVGQQDLISEEDALRIAEEKSGYYDGQTVGEEYVILFAYCGNKLIMIDTRMCTRLGALCKLKVRN